VTSDGLKNRQLEDLMHAAQAGDNAAYTKLFRKITPLII